MVENEHEKCTFSEFPIPTYDQWKKIAEKSLKGKAFEKLISQTYEGIDLQPLYRQEDVENLPFRNSLPGYFPFVRGTKLPGSSEKSWEVCQELIAPTPLKWNEIGKKALERGETMLYMVLSDEALFSLSTLMDMEEAFSGINLEEVPLFIEGEDEIIPILALLAAYMKKEKQDVSRLKGTIGSDPYASLVVKGKLMCPVSDIFDRMAHSVQWGIENAPDIETIFVKGNVYHDGGANGVQELAFVLATAVEYVRELEMRGLPLDQIAPRILFSFSVGSKFFMEIAKLRAARLLWANIIKTLGGNETSQKMKMFTRTSAWTKTIYDPYVNMLRGTSESFAAVIGGADRIHVSEFTEPLGASDDFSRRIARNTQMILNEEAHLARTLDPAGGSWYIESLTDAIAKKAWELFQRIEEQGGMLAAIKHGFPQKEVYALAKKREKNIATRKDRIVGTNMYPNLEEKFQDKKKSSHDIQHCHIKNVVDLEAWKEGLHEFDLSLAASYRIMQRAINAIEKNATVDDLKAHIWQATKKRGADSIEQVEKIPTHRGAEAFERVRIASEAYEKSQGKSLQVFLVNLGPLAQHKARADFIRDFFNAGGIQTVYGKGVNTVEEALLELPNEVDLIAICGNDEKYKELVPSITKKIKAHKSEVLVFLAGLPDEENREIYKSSGIDAFIESRTDVLEIIAWIQKVKGILR